MMLDLIREILGGFRSPSPPSEASKRAAERDRAHRAQWDDTPRHSEYTRQQARAAERHRVKHLKQQRAKAVKAARYSRVVQARRARQEATYRDED